MKFSGFLNFNESSFQNYYWAVIEELRKMKDVNIQKKQDCISFTTDFFAAGTTTDALLKYDRGTIKFDKKENRIDYNFSCNRFFIVSLSVSFAFLILSIFLFWQFLFAIILLAIQEIIHYFILKKNFKIFIENVNKRANENDGSYLV